MDIQTLLASLPDEPKESKELFRGAWNVPLNESGRAEAVDAAQRTAGQFSRIYASPLGRAQETTQEIAKTNPQAPVVTTPALKPWVLGGHEGEEVTPERIADLNERIANRPDEPIPGLGKMSGAPGETFNQFKNPLLDHVIQQIKTVQPGEKILNVTHYRDIHAIESWLRAGGKLNKSIDIGEMTSKGDEKPGQMFKLERGGLKEVSTPDDPGIYFLRHGETAANEGAGRSAGPVADSEPTPPGLQTPPPVDGSVGKIPQSDLHSLLSTLPDENKTPATDSFTKKAALETTEPVTPHVAAPPNHVARVSPLTPNPPTAALPTMPESPATISIQLAQLGSGIRSTVMIPKGTQTPNYSSLPPNVALASDPYGNQYFFRKDLIDRSRIESAAKNNKLPEVLGHAQMGLGAPDKSELPPNPHVVVVHAPDGTEVQSAATSPEHLTRTLAAMEGLKPHGGTVSLSGAAPVLWGRS